MCYRTFRLKGKDDPIPCGKCAECRTARANAWAFRLLQELKYSKNGYFITLTFNEESVPINDNGFPTLQKREIQLFIKRLRRAHGIDGRFIKYYAVGEYGGETERPHYHIILYNVKIDLIEKCWKTYGIRSYRKSKRSKRVLHAEIYV